jgi:hypothetical protein
MFIYANNIRSIVFICTIHCKTRKVLVLEKFTALFQQSVNLKWVRITDVQVRTLLHSYSRSRVRLFLLKTPLDQKAALFSTTFVLYYYNNNNNNKDLNVTAMQNNKMFFQHEQPELL